MIADLAARQHGVVARRQLLRRGLGRRAIGHRLETGHLHPVHRGVYAVGHKRLTKRGRYMAAVLASGPGAALSHRSAADLRRVSRTSRTLIEVTVPRAQRARPGIQLHRTRLMPDEVEELDGIPVTTTARTLLDLASVVDRHALERAIAEAEARRLTDITGLHALLARYPRRKGAPAMRAALAHADAGITRSELETRFLRLLDGAGLPRPELNAPLELAPGEWVEADCVWRRARLVVELDGHEHHGTRRAFERDRARDRALQARRWRTVRVTWRQLAREPERVAADLRRLL